MKIYIDVLLLENFLVNFFLMYITSETLNIRPKMKKMILPSFVAALYTLIILIPNNKIFTSVPMKVLYSSFFIYLYFKKRNFGFIIKSTAVYVMYSMLLAGICIFIDMESKGGIILYYNSIDFSYKFIMIAVMIIYISFRSLIYFFIDRRTLSQLIYKVEIEGNGWKRSVKAFLDTGNELIEPATRLPVLVIEESVLKGIKFDERECLYIPYQAVGGKIDRMDGYKIKNIRIFLNDDETKDIKAVIGICSNKLSADSEYNGLLSRSMMVNIGR